MGELQKRTDLLLVEDDARIAELLSKYLGKHGFVVTHCADGNSGASVAASRSFDIIVLDLMLPGRDGLEVCRAIRTHSRVPIIMVTALGEEADRVSGLELGADDYMVKPISARELLARIRALLRRVGGDLRKAEPIRTGTLTLYRDDMRATQGDQALDLTAYEFTLLCALAERPGRTLSREQLLDLISGSAEEAFERSIDVQISRLRKRLGDHGRSPSLIKTVRGVGYRLVTGE